MLVRQTVQLSSTLLKFAAEVHRVQVNDIPTYSYILIPDGTDLDLALKVDKIHLARLSVQANCIFGSKVVQRSLGSHSHVWFIA